MTGSMREQRERGVWDYGKVSAGRYRGVEDALVAEWPYRDEAADEPVYRWVDVGSSSGDSFAASAAAVAAETGTEIETVAIEQDEARARLVYDRDNADHVVRADAAVLPVADAAADVVTLLGVSSFLLPQHQYAQLREVERVLAPDGVAAVQYDPGWTTGMADSETAVLHSAELSALLEPYTERYG